MKITLHKASVLQGEIRDIVNGYNAIVRAPSVTVSIYDRDVAKTIKDAREKLIGTREKITSLNKALYAIRTASATANAETGISTLLTDIALAESEMSYAKATASYPVSVGIAEVRAEIAAEVSRGETVTSYRSTTKTVTVNLTSSEDVAAAGGQLLELRRKIRRGRDEVSRLNSVTQIELSDEVVETLKSEGLF